MPDEDQLFLRPADPPSYDERHLTDSGLEFIMQQIAALPTRRDLAKYSFALLFVGAVIGIVGIEAFWHYYIPTCPNP